MIVALIILSSLIVVGGLLYLHHRLTQPANRIDDTPQPASVTTECCGMHITCEKDSLLVGTDDEIVYYDDEELDTYAGKSASDYTEEQIEQFRDVLLTLLPDDIAGWARSLQMRNIVLPEAVRDELLMIVAEARQNSASAK